MLQNLFSRKAIFLDRDGVINQERADYVKSWTEFHFIPDALDAIPLMSQIGWPIIIMSNQSAIGRGIVNRGDITEIHNQMVDAIKATGGHIDGIYICPHHPNDQCSCRKPKPGLLLKAAKDMRIHLQESFFIGDSTSDLHAALAAGCKPILVQSGRQGKSLEIETPKHLRTPIYPDLLHATRHLIDLQIV